MMRLGAVAVALGAIVLFGCSSSSGPDAGVDAGPISFSQPTGTVAVNFIVDDSANQVYAQGDLQWKGEVKYDPATRIGILDATWGGPFANLYDDGPWDNCPTATTCGHEPSGSTAGDHKWGVTAFIAPPATGSATYSYGLQDANAVAASCTVCVANGWSWIPTNNGSFVVNAGATAPINAAGQTFPKFGTTDLVISLDTSLALSQCQIPAASQTACVNGACPADAGPAQTCNSAGKCVLASTTVCTTGGAACPTGQTCQGPDFTKVTIKGSGWGWNEVPLTASGTVYTYTQSAFTGSGHDVPHSGLFVSGAQAQFVFVFNGVEYRDRTQTGGPCATQGVTAMTGTGTTLNVQVLNGNNTYVTIPKTARAAVNS